MNFKKCLLMPTMLLLCCPHVTAATQGGYAKKNTIEVSGQASVSYTSAPNSRTATTFFSLGVQPTFSYFILDTWYIGTAIQGNVFYSNYLGSSWSYVGELSGLTGKAFEWRSDIFFYGQVEIGSSLPYIQDNGLSTRYYFLRPTIGLKFLVNSVVIGLNLKYTWNQIKNSYDADYFATHNLQLGVGIGFYF